MAVYTEITPEEFELLLQSYDIGGYVSSSGIEGGVENTNYLLTTDHSKYIFTIYEKRVTHHDLPFFLGLMAHLSSKGIPSPLPIHQLSGEILGEIKGKKYAIVSFLEGNQTENITSENCRHVGEMLATIHSLSEDFSISRKNDMSHEKWLKILDDIKEDITEFYDEIKEAIDIIEAQWPSSLPSGVIHADLFPDNVLFAREEINGVIDFYFACNDFFAYDIAITINAWCFGRDNSFSVEKAKNIIAGYNSIRNLSDEELSCLPVLARGAAIRFLLSRFYDWINKTDGAMVKHKNPKEYMAKLRFHMNIKKYTEYGF